MSLPALSPASGPGREGGGDLVRSFLACFFLKETLDTRSYTLQIFHPALKNLLSRVENVSVSGSTAVATRGVWAELLVV